MSITLRKKITTTLLIVVGFSFFNLPAFSEASNFYEIPEAGRPTAAYSVCCCGKESENNQQSFYTCRYFEEQFCPENTNHYKGNIAECPSSLILTKHSD